ncbi:MAG TPA: hypothetical protein VMS17_31870 [Gemmataceae bacterium]|nr:hypothetical protein [Gemmataceae bacterium]
MSHTNGAAVASTPPLLQAAQSVWRHKGKVLIFVVAVMTGVVLWTVYGPHSYRSEAKLFLRLGRENSTLDPTATLDQSAVLTLSQSRENEINSVIEVLKSRNVIEKVVDSIGAEAVLGRQPPHDAAAGPAPPAKASDQEAAIRTLTAQLNVEAARHSDIVVITYEGPSPALSQAVVSRLIDVYLDRHLTLNRAPGEHQFVAEQADRLRDELTKAEEALRKLKESTGLVAPEAQRQLVVARISRLEDESIQASADLAAAEAQVKALRDKQASLPATVTTRTTGMPNAAADAMRAQLYALQLKELELLAQHPEQHPDVLAVRKETEAAKTILAKEETNREQVAVGPNRVYEEVEILLAHEEPVQASLRAKAAAVNDQLVQERGRLNALMDADLQLARLQREVDLKDSDYRKCAGSLEQAKIDEALEREKITNLEVVEPATFDPEAVRPRLAINLGAGLAIALLGAVALALTADRLPRRQRPTTEAKPRPAVPTNNHVAAS